jgi:hypothetical protein
VCGVRRFPNNLYLSGFLLLLGKSRSGFFFFFSESLEDSELKILAGECSSVVEYVPSLACGKTASFPSHCKKKKSITMRFPKYMF